MLTFVFVNYFSRTDNAIKNHWNSSLKKKLDFYLATGRLPPIPKNSPQVTAKDTISRSATKTIHVASDKDMVVAVETSSDTTAISKPDDSGRNQFESSGTAREVGDSSSIPANESAGSEGVECKPGSSNVDLNCGNSEQLSRANFRTTYGAKYENSGLNGNSNIEHSLNNGKMSNSSNRLIRESSRENPTCGTLCYEPLQLDGSVPFSLQNEYYSNPVLSPVGFFTPPPARVSGSYTETPESILKKAANTYPNTPSIYRRRKTGVQTFTSPSKVLKLDNDSHASNEPDRTKNNSCSEVGTFSESPASCSNVDDIPNHKAFNASPPYRIRSKRTAVVKSVEKQLEFAFDKEKNDDNMKTMEKSAKRNNMMTEDCLHEKRNNMLTEDCLHETQLLVT